MLFFGLNIINIMWFVSRRDIEELRITKNTFIT